MTDELTGRVAFVTGAARGIGLSVATALSQRGASVALADVDLPALQTATRSLGDGALAVEADVSRRDDVRRAIQETVEHFGGLDILVNNAGICPLRDFADVTEEEWDRVISINLKGLWLSMKYQIAQMLAQGDGGSIVNASSVAGLVGSRVGLAYSASKHGVTGLTRSAALEQAQTGIRVNAVCPGWVETPMTNPITDANPEFLDMLISRHPIGRVGRPPEISGLVAWLLSDASSFMTGAAIPMDGGLTAQ